MLKRPSDNLRALVRKIGRAAIEERRRTMNTCQNCYFWSEMIASTTIDGPMTSMCLNSSSSYNETMTAETHTCDAFEETGPDGKAVDNPDPGNLFSEPPELWCGKD
jgi:hypothetical protein